MEEEQKNHLAMASEVQHQQSANTEFQVSHSQMMQHRSAMWCCITCLPSAKHSQQHGKAVALLLISKKHNCMGTSCNL